MQISRFSSQFLMNYMKSAHFTNVPKCSDQQNKFQIQFSSRNCFPKRTILYMYMGTSSKVTHTKYAVAEDLYFWCKADNCDTCIEIVFTTTAYHVFFALSSRFQTHADQLLDVRNRCYCTISSHMMSTLPGLPLTLDQYQQVPEINAKLNYVFASSTVLSANVFVLSQVLLHVLVRPKRLLHSKGGMNSPVIHK